MLLTRNLSPLYNSKRFCLCQNSAPINQIPSHECALDVYMIIPTQTSAERDEAMCRGHWR